MRKQRICDICKKPFIPDSNRQNMCQSCWEKLRKRIHQKPVAGTCIICGKKTVHGKIYCSDYCQCLAKRIRAREFKEKHKQIKKDKKQVIMLEPVLSPIPNRPKTPTNVIDRAAREARKQHLSYGQYVAKVRQERGHSYD